MNRWNGVIAKGSANSDAGHNYAIEIRPDAKVTCVLGSGASSLALTSTGVLTAQQFNHLACAVDGRQVRLDLNGVLNSSAP